MQCSTSTQTLSIYNWFHFMCLNGAIFRLIYITLMTLLLMIFNCASFTIKHQTFTNWPQAQRDFTTEYEIFASCTCCCFSDVLVRNKCSCTQILQWTAMTNLDRYGKYYCQPTIEGYKLPNRMFLWSHWIPYYRCEMLGCILHYLKTSGLKVCDQWIMRNHTVSPILFCL